MRVTHFKSLASTNKKAREFNDGNVVIAEMQTKGRGKNKRKWHSGRGGMWISIVLMPKTDNIWEITFVASIAVQRSIKEVCSIETRIKWPNDIIYDDGTSVKKLCGILTESIFKGCSKKMIVGIGLNANNSLPYYLKDKATSLKDITGQRVNMRKLTCSLLRNFDALYDTHTKKGFMPLLMEWKRLCGIFGRSIKIITQRKAYYGKAIDVDDECRLVVRLKDGSIKRISEGDVVVLK